MIEPNPPRQTTKETLDRVKDLQVEIGKVQDQLRTIETQLDNVLAEVQMVQCRTENKAVDAEFNRFKTLWDEYYDTNLQTSLLNRQIR